MAKPLAKEQVQAALSKLQFNWSIKDGSLLIEIETADFVSGVWAINEIAKAAEELDHHPDLKLENYNHLAVRLSSHEVSGITEQDLALAEKIDAILSRAARASTETG